MNNKPEESSCVYNSHGTPLQGAALSPGVAGGGAGLAPTFDGESRSSLRVFSSNEAVKNLPGKKTTEQLQVPCGWAWGEVKGSCCRIREIWSKVPLEEHIWRAA